MNLVQQVYSLMQKYKMVKKGDKILIGVSGGPDSIALLHILWMLRDELKVFLRVVHLNHMLRAEDAEADAQLVMEFTGKLNLSCTVEKIDVRAYQKKSGLSIQEAARELRYAFFEKEAYRTGANKVALGHHADDQAETIILNLLRGTGIRGLKGIPPVRDLYIRPLFEFRRRQIEDYCRLNQLPTRQDLSNLKPVYTRNRIRLELIPVLEQNYNPQIVNVLIRLGHICREEDAYIEQRAKEVFQIVLQSKDEDGLFLDKLALQAQPLALCRRVLRLAWQDVSREIKELSYYHVEKLVGLLKEEISGRFLSLPQGVMAVRTQNSLRLYKRKKDQSVPFYKYPLNVPGATCIPEINIEIRAEILPVDLVPSFKGISSREALLDYDLIRHPLWVRRRQEGDVFKPLGLGGCKVKLKKFFVDKKVKKNERDRIPIIISKEEIVWVGGLRPSEQFKLSENTKTCLHLQMVEYSLNP